MPEATSTPSLVALSITSQELGRGAFLPPPNQIGLSNSPTTIGLRTICGMHKSEIATWVSEKLLGFVCFEFLLERISFVCNRKSL